MKKPILILTAAVALLAVAAYLLAGRSAGRAMYGAQAIKEPASVTTAAATTEAEQGATGHGASDVKTATNTKTPPANAAAGAQVPRPAVPTASPATMTRGGKEIALGVPNEVGVYSRQHVQPGEKVSVRVAFAGDEGAPGDEVAVAVEDGGQLDNSERVVVERLDERRQVAFQYTTGREPGIYRVTLRKGAKVKTVELWAGPELKLAGE